MNSDSIEKQFGDAVVYGKDPIILTTISRIPGSIADGKGNSRDEKGNEEKELDEKKM